MKEALSKNSFASGFWRAYDELPFTAPDRPAAKCMCNHSMETATRATVGTVKACVCVDLLAEEGSVSVAPAFEEKEAQGKGNPNRLLLFENYETNQK